MGFTPEGGFTKGSRWLYKEEQVAAAPGMATSPPRCWEIPFVTRRGWHRPGRGRGPGGVTGTCRMLCLVPAARGSLVSPPQPPPSVHSR